MKSILFINYEYPPVGGGAATATYHFAMNLAKSGNKVSVLTSAYKHFRGCSIEESVIVNRISACRGEKGRSSLFQMLMFVVSALLHLKTVVDSEKPSIGIVFFSFPCGIAGLALKKLFRIPYVVMLRGGDVPGFEPAMDLFHRLLSGIRQSIYHNSRAVIANSQSLCKLAVKADPLQKIEVVNNGVDVDFFSPLDSNKNKSESLVFLYAGRLCKQKNIPTLISAFSKVNKLHPVTRLIIVGQGPEETALKKQVQKLNVEHKIEWVPWQSKDNLREYYQSSHCFVNPSSIEGMSNCILEAMACCLPVIAGDCSANRELVIEGKSGFLVSPEDEDAFSERMIYLVKNSQGRQVMGETGRNICVNRYSWPAVARQLYSLISIKDNSLNYDAI